MDKIATLEDQILDILDPKRPLSPSGIADQLGLDFSKESMDRVDLGRALNKLQEEDPESGRQIQFTRRGFILLEKSAPIIEKQETSYQTFVGVVSYDENGNSFVKPAQTDFNKAALKSCDLPEGTIVTVQMAQTFNACATIIHNHGHLEQDAGLSKLTALSLGIPIEFPKDILDDAPALTVPPPSKNRKDFTHLPFVTVDPVTAQDFDDAICVRKVGKNWQVMVAVADVSHYVRPGTKLFHEARLRGNSTYMPDIVFPMLPPELSNDLCSLKPNENRACIVTTMTINSEGQILKYAHDRALIKSRARLTYEEVQGAIEGTADRQTQKIYNQYLAKAYGAYQSLLKERANRGALDLDLMEQNIHITKSGKLRIIAEQGNESHGIIEELMIAANRCAIEGLRNKGSRIIARVHGVPNENAYDRSIGRLKRLGVEIPSSSLPIEQRIRLITEQSRQNPNRDKIQMLMIRIQDRAHYSTELQDHFGLQLKAYTHKTSPIRRMTDLIIDMLLNEHYLGGVQLPHKLKSVKSMNRMARHFSEREQLSRKAEEESSRRVTANWIKDNTDKVFDAQVCSVTKQGLIIRVLDPEIKVTMKVKNPYEYRSGDEIIVKATHADPITGVIQLKCVGRKADVDEEDELLTYSSIGELPFMQAPKRKNLSL